MQVANSAAGVISKLVGDDLVIRPMPATGLAMPGANDAVVTGDGVVIIDADGEPIFFITISGMVVGRAPNFIRDVGLAQKLQADAQRSAASAELEQQ